MIKATLQIAVAALIAAAGYAWYGQVMPYSLALMMALLIFGFAIYSILSGSLKFSKALLGGAVLAVWPLGVIVCREAASLGGFALTDHEALAGAWPLALVASKASFALAEKRDRARDIGNLSLGAIAIYTAWVATWSGQPLAMAFAAMGTSAIAANASHQIILPPQHERYLMTLAKIAGCAAVVLLLRAWVLG